MKIIGIVMVLISPIAAWIWVIKGGYHFKGLVVACLITLFSGSIFLFMDRLTELSIAGIGTIKAAATQAKQYAEEIGELRDRMEGYSQKLDAIVREASFMQTFLAAQTNDRIAFDKLKSWADDKSNPFSSRAYDAWLTIMEQHAGLIYLSGFQVPWSEGIDPSKLTLDQLIKAYRSGPTHLKVALIEYIWEKRQDLPKKTRMQFLVDVIENDKSLTAVEYAGRYFTGAAGLNLKPLAVDAILQWWEKNKDGLD